MSGELVEDVGMDDLAGMWSMGVQKLLGGGGSVVLAGVLGHYDYCDGDQDEGDADQ